MSHTFFATFWFNCKVGKYSKVSEVIKSSYDKAAMNTIQHYLIALNAVLFDLVKLAFELSLSFQALLSPPHIDDFPIDLLSIHFVNCL